MVLSLEYFLWLFIWTSGKLIHMADPLLGYCHKEAGFSHFNEKLNIF